jgi:hypothetical protein
MERLVTTKKLKSSLPVAKENEWIILAFEKVNFTSSAESSDINKRVSTLSLIVIARHFLLGCTAAANNFGY